MNLQAFINKTDFAHSRKVSELSGLLAGYMGYSGSEAEIIEQAALFHDIGKCDIPPEILGKPGGLTSQEFEIVKTHTLLGGERIKEALQILFAAYLVANNHHEKLDGTGYNGLLSDKIHPYAKLVSVADVFDALASKRAYKDAWSIDDVFGYLKNQSGTQFDVEIVAILLAHKNEVAALYR